MWVSAYAWQGVLGGWLGLVDDALPDCVVEGRGARPREALLDRVEGVALLLELLHVRLREQGESLVRHGVAEVGCRGQGEGQPLANAPQRCLVVQC